MENIDKILREKAELGYDELIDFIDSNSELFYEQTTDDEGTIEVEVYILDDNEGTDFLGRFYFDKDNNIFEEI